MNEGKKNSKTKRVAGVDLSADRFAYVGDPKDTKTWLFPIYVPGNEQLTANLISNALNQFDQAKCLPDSERAAVWFTLYGAAISHRIPVTRRTFAETPSPVPVPEVVKLVDPEGVFDEAELDRVADGLLRRLGLT